MSKNKKNKAPRWFVPAGLEPTEMDKIILDWQEKGKLVPTPNLNKTKEQIQGIRKAGDFYCSADAGLSFSWRIWRFTLNMTPTVHYNFTENFRIYSDNEATVHPQDTPIPWLFSMNFGIGYLF